MGSKIFVGGLPYSADDSQLGNLFTPHGTVESARVITDRMTGKSRGFGFVEMSSNAEAEAAIAALDGTEMEGRTLAVNKARPQAPRMPAGDGYGGGHARSGPDRRRQGPGRRGRGRW